MTLRLFFEIAFSSMIPITEIQGAIPFFLAIHPEAPRLFVMASAMIGAMVPPLILLKLLPFLTNWLHQHLHLKPHSKLVILQKTLNWFYSQVHQKHSKSFERFGALALVVITGIPLALPGSGVWSGSALAFLFNIPYRKALSLIALGIIISGILVTLFSSSIISALS